MKSKISTVGDITIVELNGYLDFENASPIAQSIQKIYSTNKQAKIVVDMSGLEFVGSSGISSFVKSMRVFNRLRMKPAYCGLKTEFVRLFRAFEDANPFDIWDEMDGARDSAQKRYAQWEARTLRSKSTH